MYSVSTCLWCVWFVHIVYLCGVCVCGMCGVCVLCTVLVYVHSACGMCVYCVCVHACHACVCDVCDVCFHLCVHVTHHNTWVHWSHGDAGLQGHTHNGCILTPKQFPSHSIMSGLCSHKSCGFQTAFKLGNSFIVSCGRPMYNMMEVEGRFLKQSRESPKGLPITTGHLWGPQEPG